MRSNVSAECRQWSASTTRRRRCRVVRAPGARSTRRTVALRRRCAYHVDECQPRTPQAKGKVERGILTSCGTDPRRQHWLSPGRDPGGDRSRGRAARSASDLPGDRRPLSTRSCTNCESTAASTLPAQVLSSAAVTRTSLGQPDQRNRSPRRPTALQFIANRMHTGPALPFVGRTK